MEKINFEDGKLVRAGYVEIDGVKHEVTEAEYEGNTPLSSFVLNKIQDNIEEEVNTQINEVNTQLTNIEQEGIIVSPTEPAENRRKVWMQKGKNLFNKNNIAVGSAIRSSDGVITSSSLYYFCGYIPVTPNTTYSRSVTGTNANTFLDKNKQYISYADGTTFTTPESCYYVGFNITVENYTNKAYEDFVVNQGDKLINYEEYIEPKTYILNDNNVYEEFMKKNNHGIKTYTYSGTTNSYGNSTSDLLAENKIPIFVQINIDNSIHWGVPYISTTTGRIGFNLFNFQEGTTIKNTDFIATIYYIEL